MTSGEPRADAPSAPVPVAVYRVVALAGLGLVMLLYVNVGTLDHMIVGVVAFLVGLLGLVARFHSAPLMVLLVLALGELFPRWADPGSHLDLGQLSGQSFDAIPALACAGLLAYVAGQYRLLALTAELWPTDPREQKEGPRRGRRRKQAPAVPPTRDPEGFDLSEVVPLVLSLPVFALLAQLVWGWLNGLPRDWMGLPSMLGRLTVLTWVVFVAVFLVAALLGAWRRRRMSPDEAALILQDAAWQETRREQRRAHRWAARARLRHDRGKERP